MNKRILIFICLITLIGCSEHNKSQSEGRTAATQQSGKMLVPIRATLEVVEEPIVREHMRLNLHVEYLRAEGSGRVVFESSGVIQKLEPDKKILAEWTSIKAGQTAVIPITINAQKFGEGSIRVKVEAYDQNGKFHYSSNPTQYFLVKGEEVLTGRSGFTDLKLQYIAHLKENGKISYLDYLRRKEKILSGN